MLGWCWFSLNYEALFSNFRKKSAVLYMYIQFCVVRCQLLVPKRIQCHISSLFSHKTKCTGLTPLKIDRKVPSSSSPSIVMWPFLMYYLHPAWVPKTFICKRRNTKHLMNSCTGAKLVLKQLFLLRTTPFQLAKFSLIGINATLKFQVHERSIWNIKLSVLLQEILKSVKSSLPRPHLILS